MIIPMDTNGLKYYSYLFRVYPPCFLDMLKKEIYFHQFRFNIC